MAKVLGVGIATLDIINFVHAYPREDEEVRASGQRIARGGNATNSLSVLAQLGHQCSWAGVFTNDASMDLIRNELDQDGIDMRWAYSVTEGSMPVSCVVINDICGSRTIVHYRDLPEFGFEQFAKIDLGGYGWLHFEGRNIQDTLKMIEHARMIAPELPISVEIEKPRANIECLVAHADLCLFSKEYARASGYEDAQPFLGSMSRRAPGVDLVCAWGEDGAYARTRQGDDLHSRVVMNGTVIDTLGAGDVLNAGLIHSFLNGWPLARGLDFSCQLAGRKCAQQGMRALV